MEESNKAIVEKFITKVFNQKDAAAVDETVGDVYIQHNPGTEDGKEALRGMLQYVSPQIKTARSLQMGEFVLQHNQSTGWGDDKTYVTFDLFRIKDSKIVEHWDIMQEMVEKTASGRTQIDGPTEIQNIEETEANKKVVQAFLDDCVYGHNWQNIANYISAETYHQHNPSVPDGLDGFNESMKQMAAHGMTMAFEKTYRLIAEGNFVFVHSSGEFGGKKVAFGDLMRLENGKIVEHWDAIQETPATSKNGHDMFAQVTD